MPSERSDTSGRMETEFADEPAAGAQMRFIISQ